MTVFQLQDRAHDIAERRTAQRSLTAQAIENQIRHLLLPGTHGRTKSVVDDGPSTKAFVEAQPRDVLPVNVLTRAVVPIVRRTLEEDAQRPAGSGFLAQSSVERPAHTPAGHAHVRGNIIQEPEAQLRLVQHQGESADVAAVVIRHEQQRPEAVLERVHQFLRETCYVFIGRLGELGLENLLHLRDRRSVDRQHVVVHSSDAKHGITRKRRRRPERHRPGYARPPRRKAVRRARPRP